MTINIALVGWVDDCGPDMNLDATLTIVCNIEEPSLLREMESNGERLVDGVIISIDSMDARPFGLSDDVEAALQVFEDLLVLDNFRNAFEYILNEARKLGTSRSDHHYCAVAIKARKQFAEAAAQNDPVGGKLHSGDPIRTEEEDLEDEPHRRTHN